MDIQSLKPCCINSILTDDLLVEIICRLPCAESVIQCKCVCKHWFRLISQPELAVCFIAHKISSPYKLKNEKREKNGELFSFSFNYHGCYESAFFYPSSPAITSLDSSLSFIPSCGKGAEFPIIIRAWCNDLILCSRLPPGELCSSLPPEEADIYICNPRTKQWIQVPAPSQREQYCLAGFTCEPNYALDEETGTVTFGTSWRYSVCYGVSFRSSLVTQLEMEIFSSETGVWKKAVLLTPEHISYFYAKFKNCFTYNKMVHFYTNDAIIGFDPYNISEDGVIHGHVIQLPPHDIPNLCCGEYIKVSGQKIILAVYCGCLMGQQPDQASIEPHNAVNTLKVWELKNYDTGDWSMMRMIDLHDLVLVNSDVIDVSQINGCWMLSIHPNDADIMLLMLGEQFVECNLQEKTWKLICCISRAERYCGLEFPWWPSPLLQ